MKIEIINGWNYAVFKQPGAGKCFVVKVVHEFKNKMSYYCLHLQLTPQRHLEMSCEQKLLACKRIGQAINMAVDRLVTIGEIISEGFQDIKGDMFDCCKDARDTGIFHTYIHVYINSYINVILAYYCVQVNQLNNYAHQAI